MERRPNPVSGPSSAAAAPLPLEHTASPMRHRPPTSSAVGPSVEGHGQASGQQRPAHLDQLDKFDTVCASISPSISRSTVTPSGVGYARPGEVPTADNRCPVCQVVFPSKNPDWQDHVHTCTQLAMASQLIDGYLNLVKRQQCPCSQRGEGPWDQHALEPALPRAQITPSTSTHHGYLPSSVLNHSLASRVYYCETCEEW